jgi:L-ribulokinase
MSAVVAGVDFGTLTVRVSIFDSVQGRLGTGIAEYPLHRRREDPNYAIQSHTDHMNALIAAMRSAIAASGISGDLIEALAIDTTASSVKHPSLCYPVYNSAFCNAAKTEVRHSCT